MGCWAPRDRNEHYYYCVVEEKAEATGFAVTVISEMGGGKFTASSGAHDSCEKNLGRHACGNHLSEAHDVKAVSIDCHEI
jgi:hypothetical protein